MWSFNISKVLANKDMVALIIESTCDILTLHCIRPTQARISGKTFEHTCLELGTNKRKED